MKVESEAERKTALTRLQGVCTVPCMCTLTPARLLTILTCDSPHVWVI